MEQTKSCKKKFITQDNSVDANELEAALAHMKQMQNEQLTAPPRCFFRLKLVFMIISAEKYSNWEIGEDAQK